MENNHSQPVLTAPLNFIILPTTATTTGTTMMPTFQPLTVITTTALNGAQPTPAGAVASMLAAPAAPTSASKTYSGTPPLKPAKKFRSEQEEILRCKRRLDFAPMHGMGLQKPHTATVMRRNERERNRVKLINNTFVRLREHLPVSAGHTTKGKAKKLSKVDTLQRAIDYIAALQQLIDEHDAVNAAFDHGGLAPALEPTTASSPADSAGLDSPGSACESEPFSDEPPLSPEEVDLLDFTSWFQ